MSENIWQDLPDSVVEFILLENTIMQTSVVQSAVTEYLDIYCGAVHDTFVTALAARV
jgi:hypothetical protein